MHKLKGVIDAFEGHSMSNQIVDINTSLHIPIDYFWNIAPALRAAKRGAFPCTSGYQLERPGCNLLAGRSHPDYHAGALSALAAFERLAHQFNVADAFEGKIGAALGKINKI